MWAIAAALAWATGLGWTVVAGAEDAGEGRLVLATGRLTDAAGRPQAGAVRAYAWPVDRRRARSLPLAAASSADSSGRFILHARDPRQLTRLSRKKGSVDLLVVGTTRGTRGDTVFSSRAGRPAPAIAVATRASSAAEARAASHDCSD